MGYAFISYSSKNAEIAEALRRELNDRGVQTWMAPGDIPAGSEYSGVITRALRNSACLVLLLTNDSQDSIWVNKEVERSLSYGKPVIPIALGEVTLNDSFEFYLAGQQIVPVRRIASDNQVLAGILEQIAKLVGAESLDVESGEAVTPAAAETAREELGEHSSDLEKKAAEGDRASMVKLAKAYEYGRDGYEVDPVKAIYWRSMAAEGGSAQSQYSLAWVYKWGEGVEEDPKKAFYWFKKASEQGYPPAISNLADCYRKGYGVEKDSAQAVQWLLRADRSSVCCMALGEMYELGEGVERDLERALDYYELAESIGGVAAASKRAIDRVVEKIRRRRRLMGE